MVQKRSMSRCPEMHIIWFLAVFFTFLAGGAWPDAFAVDQETKDEIVYRANLGRADDVKLLVEKGVSPDQVDGKGVPLISLAAVRTDPEGENVLKTLLEIGANINAVDHSGQTALFYAAKANNVKSVKFLLDHKADLQIIDFNGNTARATAALAGNLNIVQIMDDYVRAQNAKIAEQNAKAAQEALEKQKQKIAEQQKTIEMQKSIDKALQGDGTATQPGAKPSVAAPADQPAPITDAKSKAAAEERIQKALDPTSEQPAPPAGDKPKEPSEIDEKKLEAAAEEKRKDSLEQKDSSGQQPSAPKAGSTTPKQNEAFDTIIKHDIKTVAASQPASVATEPASATNAAKEAPPAKTPEQIADEKEVLAEAQKEQAEADAAAKKEKDEQEQKRAKEIKQMAYDVAYHTCSFQYWAFCLEIRQSSELSHEEMEISIQTQKDAVEATEKKLLVDYKQPASFYDNITHSAQDRIYSQLTDMHTNRVRHENGVGKLDDMDARCGEIGRQWGFPTSIKPEEIPFENKGGGKITSPGSNAGGKGGAPNNAAPAGNTPTPAIKGARNGNGAGKSNNTTDSNQNFLDNNGR